MEQVYPWSRIQVRTCPACAEGTLRSRGRSVFTDQAGHDFELLRLSCPDCGYTMLFDMDVPRHTPRDGEVLE